MILPETKVISKAEADHLRKVGHPSARPGPYVFPTERQLTQEDGRWGIDLPQN